MFPMNCQPKVGVVLENNAQRVFDGKKSPARLTVVECF